jgi:conjugative transposon TraM protein
MNSVKLRRRKMLLVLPLLVVPFLTLLFWALGGGKQSTMTEQRSEGINLNLPGAALKDDKGLDKLSFYDLAQKDSMKLGEQLKADRYWKEVDSVGMPALKSVVWPAAETHGLPISGGLRTTPYEGKERKPEEELLQKIAQLQKGFEEGTPTPVKNEHKMHTTDSESLTGQVDRLETMLQGINEGSEVDPEMAQLQSTLEKLLDVQHPERVRERIMEKSLQNKRVVYPLTTSSFGASYSLLDTGKTKGTSKPGFFSLASENNPTEGQNAVRAVVEGTQTMVDGGTLRMRLLEESWIAGIHLPKETALYGRASLQGERLRVTVSFIRYGTSLFPVDLEVFDLDGLAGISVPGSMTREVAKESVNEASSLIGITSLDPSLKAQAASTGLDAVKKLISKKAKLVKVTVKSGYMVLLQTTKN